MPVDHFGEAVAARYDETAACDVRARGRSLPPSTSSPASRAAAPRSSSASARAAIALPLARRGVPVHGIDLSEAMVARMREKPGGGEIPVAIGDFATTRVPGTFSLAYLVFNTIMNLTTQEEQVACFENAAAHLEPGGRFLIEVGVPQLQRLPPGETVRPFHLGPTHLGFDEYDVVAQGLVSHHWSLSTDVARGLDAVPLRLAGRARPDGAARRHAAARALGGWSREPFTRESTSHVSVWERPS